MSIDTRYLESGARIRPGSPHASPSTNGQSDTPFAQFLSAADSRASTKPEPIAPQVNDTAVLQRRSDESAQARRQVERQREARTEGSTKAKPSEKTADDAESKQAMSSADSDPATKPGMSAQRSAENRNLAPKAQGRGPRDPQDAKSPRGPQDPDQADTSQADAPAGTQARAGAAHRHRGGQSAAQSASAAARQAPDGSDSAAAQADTVPTTDAAQAALPENASASLQAIEGQSEDDKASIARKKLTPDQADGNAAATAVATITQPLPDASLAAAAQTMVTTGSEKSVSGKSDVKADKPAINKTSETGGAAQTVATGATANGDAIVASGGDDLGAGPETRAQSGKGAARATGADATGTSAGTSAATSAALPQALRDAQAADAASALRSSAIDNARPLSDNAAISPTGLPDRPQAIGPQGSGPAALADQGMVTPGSFAGLLRSAEASGDARSEALARPQNFPITVPFDDPRFGSALSERVQWLVKEGIQSAELTLHPQDMGPIRIEMSIDGTAASIDFAATQADTRAAIEQSLPRLRDLLADQGLQLGGTQIGADTSRQDNPGSRTRQSGGASRTATVGIPEATSDGVPVSGMPAQRRNAAGRIDLFA
jgi:flagellar hook-length control protein FliK